MVAFPIHGLKISTSGDIVTVSMTDDPNAEDLGFKYYAHQRRNTKKDVFYLGAYLGFEYYYTLRSLSGTNPRKAVTLSNSRLSAQMNGKPNGNGGSGYDILGFYQLVYLQAMYLLKYKNLNSQSAIGRGFVDGNSGQKATGGTETWGLTKGETTGKDHMKLFGIEDLWGNTWDWIDGFYSDSDKTAWTATENFNDDFYGYTNQGTISTSNLGLTYVTTVAGTTEKGFLPTTNSGGSTTTYFCDIGVLSPSCIMFYGGRWHYGDQAGIFCYWIGDPVSYYTNYISSRLMYV